jgi:hypothetical protein
VANRFLSGLIVLSFVGVCYSFQGGDTGLVRDKQGDEKRPVVLKQSVLIPTPGKDEGVVIFENGDFALIHLGQNVSIPPTEKFRGIWGENVTLIFLEKGQTSGNNVWKLDRR